MEGPGHTCDMELFPQSPAVLLYFLVLFSSELSLHGGRWPSKHRLAFWLLRITREDRVPLIPRELQRRQAQASMVLLT